MPIAHTIATLREPPDRAAMTRPFIDEMLAFAAQAQGQVALDQRTALVVAELVRSYAP